MSQLSLITGRLPRWLVALVLAGSMASVMSVARAEPAAASAYSCTGYGYLKWAQFCGHTVGNGTYVQTAGAGFSSAAAWAGWLTNTRVRLEFMNTSGHVYLSGLSGQQNGGSAVGAWKWTLNRHVQRGTVRYTLLSNGATIAAVQHTIK